MNDNLPPARTARPCPICGKPAVERFMPFCSARCADVDLQKWLTGAYAIPVVDDESSAEDGLDQSGREGAGQGRQR